MEMCLGGILRKSFSCPSQLLSDPGIWIKELEFMVHTTPYQARIIENEKQEPFVTTILVGSFVD